jgi:hypothetical protein
MQESARAAVSYIRAGRRSDIKRELIDCPTCTCTCRPGDSQGRTIRGDHDGDRDRLGAAKNQTVREDVAMTEKSR